MLEASGIFGLARVLIPEARGVRHLAMFSAYLDESGKGRDRQSFLALGSFVASDRQWRRLEVQWKRVLLSLPDIPVDAVGDPKPFHMTDFEAGHWPLKGYPWQSEARKNAFLNRLLSIICRCVAGRFFSAVLLDHCHLVFPKERKRQFPWVLSALGCAVLINRWATDRVKDQIPLIFEGGGEGWAKVYENYQGLKRQGRTAKLKIGAWVLDDKKQSGLQAVDLWCWELRNYFRNQLRNRNYLPRPSLHRLICSRIHDGGGVVLDGKNIEALMDGLKGGPSEVQIVPFDATERPVIAENC